MRFQLGGDRFGEAFPVNSEGAARRHLVFCRCGNDQPVGAAHFLMQHADGV
jgi:hypothetical protein